jgi:hypothetical protein
MDSADGAYLLGYVLLIVKQLGELFELSLLCCEASRVVFHQAKTSDLVSDVL